MAGVAPFEVPRVPVATVAVLDSAEIMERVHRRRKFCSAASATSPGGCRGSSATRERPGNQCIPVPGQPCSLEKSLLSGVRWVSLSDMFLTRLLCGSLRLFKNRLLNVSELMRHVLRGLLFWLVPRDRLAEELENASAKTAAF